MSFRYAFRFTPQGVTSTVCTAFFVLVSFANETALFLRIASYDLVIEYSSPDHFISHKSTIPSARSISKSTCAAESLPMLRQEQISEAMAAMPRAPLSHLNGRSVERYRRNRLKGFPAVLMLSKTHNLFDWFLFPLAVQLYLLWKPVSEERENARWLRPALTRLG